MLLKFWLQLHLEDILVRITDIAIIKINFLQSLSPVQPETVKIKDAETLLKKHAKWDVQFIHKVIL
jgi:hypothetical protein